VLARHRRYIRRRGMGNEKSSRLSARTQDSPAACFSLSIYHNATLGFAYLPGEKDIWGALRLAGHRGWNGEQITITKRL